jgi:hypothetical protein
MGQVRDRWLCLEMMPDGVADFAIVAYPAFVANFGGVGWLRRLNWSTGVMESIKPLAKKIFDGCIMLNLESYFTCPLEPPYVM